MLGSRRTNKVVLMIDKVKAWCRMCTIMRDCGEEEKVLRQRRKREELYTQEKKERNKKVAIHVKEGNKIKKQQSKPKERNKEITIQVK